MSLGTCDRALSAQFDYLLLDLDGVCYRGSAPIENASEGLAQARSQGIGAAYITNNSMASPPHVAAKLKAVGIDALPEEIYTSSRTGVAQLLEHVPAGAKVLPLGTEGLFYELERADVVVVSSADDRPDAVLQGLSKDLSWAELSEAALAIRAGALYVATNLDATLPLERGQHLGCGSMVAAVVHATGVEPLSSGKPAPDMYRLAMKETGAQRPLCVGDRLNTDIAGANAAALPSFHVLTGVSQARDIMLASVNERPTFLGIDMLDINRPAPAIVRGGDEFVCGERRASIDVVDQQLILDGNAAVEADLDGYRALVAAVWSAIDDGVRREDLAWLPNLKVVR
ncbi:HAD-IIA family hydrolase [Trueperella pecoris]|uniref:HAD hydrolase-like protein n=1 Tax=Trueperella pecoris TaxID=2733571 RepID=A0A7M1QSH8_9ACTO|nr:HAD family hydrolase [Trueperella pecoris]QOQ38745.1 HAD hydrolase-like protein [Trueperella pecoris]QOR44761.1 HAD hydrolase-like protein [Trueperella pecoris]QTG74683.1 HAD hydrolase-like protein [Trueperella pecoris]